MSYHIYIVFLQTAKIGNGILPPSSTAFYLASWICCSNSSFSRFRLKTWLKWLAFCGCCRMNLENMMQCKCSNPKVSGNLRIFKLQRLAPPRWTLTSQHSDRWSGLIPRCGCSNVYGPFVGISAVQVWQLQGWLWYLPVTDCFWRGGQKKCQAIKGILKIYEDTLQPKLIENLNTWWRLPFQTGYMFSQHPHASHDGFPPVHDSRWPPKDVHL